MFNDSLLFDLAAVTRLSTQIILQRRIMFCVSFDARWLCNRFFVFCSSPDAGLLLASAHALCDWSSLRHWAT